MGIGQECLICVIRLGLVSADEARYDIISVRAEGVDMPTGMAKSRCAWEAVNVPAIRCLHSMCRGCGNGDRNLRTGGADDKWRIREHCE